MSDYFICPHCGAEVDMNAVVCPVCGSDDNTGWSDGAEYADLYLNDDYETAIESESTSARSMIDWQRIMFIAVSLLILTAMLVAIFEGFIYLAIFLIVGGGGGYYLLKQKEKSVAGKSDQNYKALLTRARGDAALAERWIAYERSRNPDAGEEQLIEAALYRWERDNR